MSNSCGHTQYTNVARAEKQASPPEILAGSDPAMYQDADWERNMWWEDSTGDNPAEWQRNTGKGWNQNRLMPIAPDPVTGQQAYHDTVVSVARIG
jgi:hypothetical protein